MHLFNDLVIVRISIIYFNGIKQPNSDSIIGAAINFIFFSLANLYGLIIGGVSGILMFLYIRREFVKLDKSKEK
jgi:hypothetical protein